MILCKIIAENTEDFEYLRSYLGNYPISLLDKFELDENIPTLIIGWQTTKANVPNANIIDKVINNNLFWTYSKTEKKEEFEKTIEEFVNKSIKNWLPKNFILFDPLFQSKTLSEFITENFDLTQISCFYFHKDALYINNNDKNYIFNIKSFCLVYDDYKTILTTFINKLNPLCFSYKNISQHINLDNLDCVFTFENARCVKYGVETDESYFRIIPGFDAYKYASFIMSKVGSFEFLDEEKKSMRRLCEKDNITEWLSSRTINFKKDFKKEGLDIVSDGNNRMATVSYSNKRTLTGRIVANSSYNPQNLDKNTNDRENIISRFKGGKIAVFDYTSFEARIGLYFCENEEFIENNKEKDIHYETARIIFGRNAITKDERDFSKTINHSILYGAAKNTIIQKISHLDNPEEIYYNIRQFLMPLLKKSEKVLAELKAKGYIINDWGTIVRPNKEWGVYSNYLSSMAVEILVDNLFEIKKFLVNYKSQFLFQVHDSVIFDICPEESFIVKKLAKILMYYKDMIFTLNYSSGPDFKNLSESIAVGEK